MSDGTKSSSASSHECMTPTKTAEPGPGTCVTGEELLALSPKRRSAVLREIARDRRSPFIPGLRDAIANAAKKNKKYSDTLLQSSILVAVKEAQAAQLHRMSPGERLHRYRNNRLVAYQLDVWERHYPLQIPRINGLPEWYARYCPEVVD